MSEIYTQTDFQIELRFHAQPKEVMRPIGPRRTGFGASRFRGRGASLDLQLLQPVGRLVNAKLSRPLVPMARLVGIGLHADHVQAAQLLAVIGLRQPEGGGRRAGFGGAQKVLAGIGNVALCELALAEPDQALPLLLEFDRGLLRARPAPARSRPRLWLERPAVVMARQRPRPAALPCRQRWAGSRQVAVWPRPGRARHSVPPFRFMPRPLRKFPMLTCTTAMPCRLHST